MIKIVMIPKEYYYHEVAYVRSLEDKLTMTRNQLNAMIRSLIDQAGIHVQKAQENTSQYAQTSWTAHITTSMVCSSLVEVLVSLRDAIDQEKDNAESEA